MTDDELEVFFDVAYDYVREAHKREDIARIRDAIHQTADYAGGNIKRWVMAVEQALDREDEGFEPVFRPDAVASAEAVLVN